VRACKLCGVTCVRPSHGRCGQGEAVPQRFVILFEDAGSKADALATLPTLSALTTLTSLDTWPHTWPP
jgi:hypothetical protein